MLNIIIKIFERLAKSVFKIVLVVKEDFQKLEVFTIKRELYMGGEIKILSQIML